MALAAHVGRATTTPISQTVPLTLEGLRDKGMGVLRVLLPVIGAAITELRGAAIPRPMVRRAARQITSLGYPVNSLCLCTVKERLLSLLYI